MAELERPALEAETMRKLTLRIVPFLMVCYVVAFIDRVNAGFAALSMNRDLGLTSAQFGLGAGVFFVGYVLCEVPSNLAMAKVGARLWIARIMITWGIVSAGMAFVIGPISFIAGRLLLGAAEAGFFPGVILYISYWFPAKYRGRVVALFSVAIPLSSMIGSPISGAILGLNGLMGLRGWQWLFILEAAPAILLGFCCLALLPNGPAQAKWLSEPERDWLSSEIAQEARRKPAPAHLPLKDVLFNKSVLVLALAYAGTAGISQGLSLWQPQMIKSFGLTNVQVGLLNGLPFAVASAAMLYWGSRSDRTRERVWHTVIPVALAAIGLICASLTGTSVALFLVTLSMTLVGTYAMKGPFWGLSTEWLSASAAAGGIAMINSLGSLALRPLWAIS
ncbi:MAG: MFS transporter [Acetobacteraceae bacterium]|nr:MFS transporter [Acetobacteraceae bacterium]